MELAFIILHKKIMNSLIIGGTSGIGRELFTQYAAQGNRIGIIGRRKYLLDELRQAYPKTTFTASADVSRIEEITLAINNLKYDLGNIYLAIVCAGTGDINTELNFAIANSTIGTNVVGWTSVIDQLYQIFEQQGFGHLVAISSIGGLRGEASAPAYSASKAYQINYLEALRKKASNSGKHIFVTDIRPGLVDTAMAKGNGLFCVMPVEKVARQIIGAIHKRKSVAYVTKRWQILAFIVKNLPFAVYKKM